MPRTKVSRSSQKAERKKSEQNLVLNFKRKSALQLARIRNDLEAECNKIITFIDIEFNKFPTEIQNLQLKDIFTLFSENLEENINKSPDTMSIVKKSTMSFSSDYGYVSDKACFTKSSHSKNKHKLYNERKVKKLHQSTKPYTKDEAVNVYNHTPQEKCKQKLMSITPKVCPNTPLNVLRQPRNGETVVSMTGSPIFVSTAILQNERMANLMLPLNNGDVLSLLPTGDLRKSLLPELNSDTVEQLKTLKSHIEKFLPKE